MLDEVDELRARRQVVTLALTDMTGYLIGRRPALLYDRLCDVATYTSIKAARPDDGLFSVGLRKTSG